MKAGKMWEVRVHAVRCQKGCPNSLVKLEPAFSRQETCTLTLGFNAFFYVYQSMLFGPTRHMCFSAFQNLLIYVPQPFLKYGQSRVRLLTHAIVCGPAVILKGASSSIYTHNTLSPFCLSTENKCNNYYIDIILRGDRFRASAIFVTSRVLPCLQGRFFSSGLLRRPESSADAKAAAQHAAQGLQQAVPRFA